LDIEQQLSENKKLQPEGWSYSPHEYLQGTDIYPGDNANCALTVADSHVKLHVIEL